MAKQLYMPLECTMKIKAAKTESRKGRRLHCINFTGYTHAIKAAIAKFTSGYHYILAAVIPNYKHIHPKRACRKVTAVKAKRS